MPLAIATAVNFTAPLFATIAAVFVLHEDVRLRRWSAIVIGFAGVLVIMRPGSERLDLNLLILLLSAASATVNNITVKFLARTEPPGRIVAMFMLPDAVIPGAGAVCRELAGPVDPRRTRWARNNRALFGSAGARCRRCQRLRTFRVCSPAVRGVGRFPVVRRGD